METDMIKTMTAAALVLTGAAVLPAYALDDSIIRQLDRLTRKSGGNSAVISKP